MAVGCAVRADLLEDHLVAKVNDPDAVSCQDLLAIPKASIREYEDYH